MNFESADALEVEWASRHRKATTCEEGRKEKKVIGKCRCFGVSEGQLAQEGS